MRKLIFKANEWVMLKFPMDCLLTMEKQKYLMGQESYYALTEQEDIVTRKGRYVKLPKVKHKTFIIKLKHRYLNIRLVFETQSSYMW